MQNNKGIVLLSIRYLYIPEFKIMDKQTTPFHNYYKIKTHDIL